SSSPRIRFGVRYKTLSSCPNAITTRPTRSRSSDGQSSENVPTNVQRAITDGCPVAAAEALWVCVVIVLPSPSLTSDLPPSDTSHLAGPAPPRPPLRAWLRVAAPVLGCGPGHPAGAPARVPPAPD